MIFRNSYRGAVLAVAMVGVLIVSCGRSGPKAPAKKPARAKARRRARSL